MFVGFITVALVDAMLFLLIRLVDTQWKERGENVPVSYAAGLFCLCCVAHFGATKTLGRVVMDETQASQLSRPTAHNADSSAAAFARGV